MIRELQLCPQAISFRELIEVRVKNRLIKQLELEPFEKVTQEIESPLFGDDPTE